MGNCVAYKSYDTFYIFIVKLHDISDHTRELRYVALRPEALEAAMLDPNTGLTHAALVGARKQSVRDAEKLLSFPVAE